MGTGVKGLMDDEAQYLGGRGGGYCRSFPLSQMLSGSCENLHSSGGREPTTGSAGKLSTQWDVGKTMQSHKNKGKQETKDKEYKWKQRN
jgi:hypothetical protein